jgi:hypothetical protein
MNAVSLSEDIFERFIEEVSQLRSELTIPKDGLDKSDAHLKACEAACARLISKLEHARAIAADPMLVTPQRVDWLQIENHSMKRELERLHKEVARLQNKFTEHRKANEKALNVQTARAVAMDKENRSLCQQLKEKNAAIEKFARTHRVAHRRKNGVLSLRRAIAKGSPRRAEYRPPHSARSRECDRGRRHGPHRLIVAFEIFP